MKCANKRNLLQIQLGSKRHWSFSTASALEQGRLLERPRNGTCSKKDYYKFLLFRVPSHFKELYVGEPSTILSYGHSTGAHIFVNNQSVTQTMFNGSQTFN